MDGAELSSFEATDAAGKAGSLLAHLAADQSEVVSLDMVKPSAHAHCHAVQPRQNLLVRDDRPTIEKLALSKSAPATGICPD